MYNKILLFLVILVIYIIFILKKNYELFVYENEKKFENYRLGDIVNGWLYKHKREIYEKYENDYPNTIAAKYISMTKNLNSEEKFQNFDLLYKIIELKKNNKKDINLHIRLGDIVRGKYNNMFIFKKNMGMQINKYNDLCKEIKLKTKERKIYLFYGCHRKCSDYSIEYLENIKNIFKKNNFTIINKSSKNPDNDFKRMCNSKLFIEGYGGFSNVISQMVKKNGGQVIHAKKYYDDKHFYQWP